MGTNKPLVLVVDDEKDIVSVLQGYLQQANYDVKTAYNGETALQIMRHDHPDMVILDIMMPQRDGLDVLRTARSDERLKDVSIILLTARIDDTDKIIGLELGADDYVTKPFNPREVVARVRTVLRRANKEEDASQLRCGALFMNLNTRETYLDDTFIKLTPTEYTIMKLLMSHPGYVFTREELAEHAFGYSVDTMERTLDNHIRNIRKKIEPDPSSPIYLHTVYGVGYRLADER
ncbi:MAG: response regulator transcription factor [Anaerolineae bacterium]|nr:response regulator transcription factor [Anaerolineae bacterium]